MKTINYENGYKITIFKKKLKIIKSPIIDGYWHKIKIIDLIDKKKPEIFYQNH